MQGPEPNEGQAAQQTLAKAARELVAGARRGVLCTLIPQIGYPYGSLVELITTGEGDVVMLLSSLAEHQRHLVADSRGSVVIAPHANEPNALAKPRVTLVGDISPVDDRRQYAAAYRDAHPRSAEFIDFPDFAFYQLHVERARYIAGFGQMGWIRGDFYRAAG
jgi:putative heme iron utilization protein